MLEIIHNACYEKNPQNVNKMTDYGGRKCQLRPQNDSRQKTSFQNASLYATIVWGTTAILAVIAAATAAILRHIALPNSSLHHYNNIGCYQ